MAAEPDEEKKSKDKDEDLLASIPGYTSFYDQAGDSQRQILGSYGEEVVPRVAPLPQAEQANNIATAAQASESPTNSAPATASAASGPAQIAAQSQTLDEFLKRPAAHTRSKLPAMTPNQAQEIQQAAQRQATQPPVNQQSGPQAGPVNSAQPKAPVPNQQPGQTPANYAPHYRSAADEAAQAYQGPPTKPNEQAGNQAQSINIAQPNTELNAWGLPIPATQAGATAQVRQPLNPNHAQPAGGQASQNHISTDQTVQDGEVQSGQGPGRAGPGSAGEPGGDFIPRTPPQIDTSNDPEKPWKSSSGPQFEFFAEAYEEAIRHAQRAREQQLKQAEADAAAEAAKKAEPTALLAETFGDNPAFFTPPEPEPLSRGAAALRAANINTREKPSKESEADFRMNRQDILGLAAYNILIAKNVITKPKDFFYRLDLQGPAAEALIFLLVMDAVSSVLRAVFTFSLGPIFIGFASTYIFTLVGAVAVNAVFNALGGKGNLNSTLRVLCFSKASLLIAWPLNFPHFELGIWAATALCLYLNYIGLSRSQELNREQTIALVLVLGILGAFVRMGAP